MECCEPTIVSFSNQATKSVPYAGSLDALYGPVPKPEVWLQDPTTFQFQEINGIPMIAINYDGVNVNFDFGGLATGVIKFS